MPRSLLEVVLLDKTLEVHPYFGKAQTIPSSLRVFIYDLLRARRLLGSKERAHWFSRYGVLVAYKACLRTLHVCLYKWKEEITELVKATALSTAQDRNLIGSVFSFVSTPIFNRRKVLLSEA